MAGDLPETPNTRMRCLAAERALARTSQPAADGNGSNVPSSPPIDPVLRGPAGQPPTFHLENRRRPRSPSPDHYRDLTPQANQLLADPNKRLKTGSASDLLYFARSRPDTRLLLVYHALLQANDKKQDATVEHWKVPPELKENISMLMYGVLMSPLIGTYRDNLIPTIVDLLRKQNLLPEGLAMASMKQVRKCISTSASNQRSSIKKKFTSSIDKQWHVAKLAQQLLAKAPDLQITAALLTRLAFVRFQLANSPPSITKGEKFWPHVSDKLNELSKSAADEHILSDFLKSYLDDDEQIYTNGKPTKVVLASPTELSDLQKRMDESAALIEINTVQQDADEEEGQDDEDVEP